jgi:hypothetical protein
LAPQRDGAFDPAQTVDSRGSKSLAAGQLWWTFTRGTAIGPLPTSASMDGVALALQDVQYAVDAGATSSIPIANGSTTPRNKWLELDYRGLADAMNKYVVLQPTLFSNLATDTTDLTKLRDLGRKAVVYNGLADDAIPPAGSINYQERVAAAMGGNDRDIRDLSSRPGTALDQLVSDDRPRFPRHLAELPTDLNTLGSRSSPSIDGQSAHERLNCNEI